VDFAPAVERGKATKKLLSWTRITEPGRRNPPRTEDERPASGRPRIAGSPKSRILNYRGRYGPRYGVVAGRSNTSRVAALLAANPRISARRIDAAINPGSRDPGNHAGAGALSD